MLRRVALLALFLAPSFASAATLYQQTATTTSLSGSSGLNRPSFYFATTTYPTIPNWDVDSVTYQANACTGAFCAGSSATLIAEVYNGTAWIAVATSSTVTIPALSAPIPIVFDFAPFNLKSKFNTVSGAIAGPSQVSATVRYWYRFTMKTTGLALADSYTIWGYDTGTTSAAFYYRRQDGQTIAPALIITGTDQTSTVTRIDSLDTPANGSTTGTNTVNFQWTIYYNDTTNTQDVTGIEVSDITNGSEIIPPTEQNITASGFSVYTATLSLDTSHEYLWRAYLRDSTGTQGYVYSSYSSFFVISNPYPYDLNVASTTVGSTTESLLPNYQNLYTYIKTKPPFGFIFQTITALQSLNASSTPAFELESEENITTNILNPMDVGLAWIIGLLFTMYMLRRLSHLEI